MPANKKDLGSRLKKAFGLRDEIARQEAILELLDLVISGRESIDDGIADLISGLEQEPGEEVLDFVWYRLSQMSPHDQIHTLAESELNNENARRREYTLRYLRLRYPEQRQDLFNRMSEDPDPWVLYNAGYCILPFDSGKAIETWLKAMYRSADVLGEELLPSRIGQYADQTAIAKLEQIVVDAGGDQRIQLALYEASKWRRLDYLEATEQPAVGEGYWIECPSCGQALGVREGHLGKRGRCRKCKHEFVIPEEPED